ncbi:MAG: CinA family nicotinamide mononucleotide deamidase-related protein [Bdellovibrionales bacterium]
MKKQLKGHLLLIGDELLSGRIGDSNGQVVAKLFREAGILLTGITTIPDQVDIMKKEFLAKWSENDVVVTSGGIGPTRDDLTKEVLATAFNKRIIPRDDVAASVTDNYLRFGREWTPTLNQYHHFPEDFIALKNAKGLAPGLAYLNLGKLICALPGVPRELAVMMEEEVLPLITKNLVLNESKDYGLTCRTFGIPEERIFNQLVPDLWDRLLKVGSVASYPQIVGVDIVVTVHGTENDRDKAYAEMKKIILSTPLVAHIWQWGNTSLPEFVLECAREKKLTIALAESCTGGLTASRLTDISGSSHSFLGSIVCYANEVKQQVLGVRSETLEKHGAVSEECAREMVLGLKQSLKADLNVSFTGIAGPTGGSSEKPVGTVCFGVSCGGNTFTEKHLFPGDRVRLKQRFSEYGLLLMLKAMEII